MTSGDFDGNGIINSLDFNLWKQSGAAVNSYSPADADGKFGVGWFVYLCNKGKIQQNQIDDSFLGVSGIAAHFSLN